MAYSFERLPQVKNLRGKLPHNGWYEVYSEHYKTDIAVHHSLTKTGNSRAFANYHTGPAHRWPEVAYHFVILKDGTIEYNHQIGVLSYHVGNSNKQAVGICLVGDFRSEEPTAEQRKSFRQLHACLKGGDMPNYKRTRGHDEFPGYAWKACPEFDYDAVLAQKTTVASGPTKIAVLPGDSGAKVKAVQNDLLTLGYDLGGYGADGSYGPATEDAVKAFQRDEGLTVDGQYGPNTHAAMSKALAEHADEKKRKQAAEQRKQKEAYRMAENTKATGFPDVDKDAFYAEDVKELAEDGLINGTPEGNYEPNRPLTRGEFAHVVNKLRKQYEGGGK